MLRKNAKILFMILMIFSMNSMACRYQILDQDGQYFLIKKSMGELPDASKEKLKTKIEKRGLIDVEIKSSEGDSVRKARIDIVFQSKNKKDVEGILNYRCPNLGFN